MSATWTYCSGPGCEEWINAHFTGDTCDFCRAKKESEDMKKALAEWAKAYQKQQRRYTGYTKPRDVKLFELCVSLGLVSRT